MEEKVVLYLEYKMSQMIEDWKIKNPGKTQSMEMFAGTFDAYLYVYGQHFIKEIEEEFQISHEQATKIFGNAKAIIYNKYIK